MSISAISSSAAFAPQVNLAAKAAPLKRDRDGDFDNNAVESKQSETAESAKGGSVLNIKA